MIMMLYNDSEIICFYVIDDLCHHMENRSEREREREGERERQTDRQKEREREREVR